MLRNRWLAFAFTAALFAGCSDDTGGSSSTGPTPQPTGSASGEISLHVGATSGTATGTVLVIIGNDTLWVPVDVTLGASGSVSVNFSFPSVDIGRATVVYVANLSVNGSPVTLAGYQFIDIVEDLNEVVEDTGFVSMVLDASITLTSGAPVFSNIALDTNYTTTANVGISGTVSNIDFDRVFIFVNGNSFQVAIDPSASGSASFSTIVTLDPGANTVYVVAVNSQGGYAVSAVQTVTFAVAGSGNVMLGTLVWNSPTSDIDFHMWYYPTPTPNLASQATYHCAFWNQDIATILPNGDEPYGNLDIDDTYGEGPEHMTFVDYPDGYYVFALNSYALKSDSSSFCTVSLSAGGSQRTMNHTFTTSNGEDYALTMDAWTRCYDIRVANGRATILNPDTAFVYHEATLSKAALPKSAKGK